MQDLQQKIYAGFLVRFAATVIDTIFTAPLIWAIFYIIGLDFGSIPTAEQIIEELSSKSSLITENTTQKIADFISWVISISYSVYFLTSGKQATPGKQIMNIYVATKDGQKLSVNLCFVRFFASILSGLLFGAGFVMIIITKEKTALHDLICNTRVFYGKNRTHNS
jgi:uncharacterized RDD family membrane protein YckC